MPSRIRDLLISALAVTFASRADAQRGTEPGGLSRHEIECREMKPAAASVSPRAGLFARLRECPVTAPEILANLWDDVSVDSSALNALSFASGLVHDERLFSKLVAVVGNRSVNAKVRAAALMAAFNQVAEGGYRRNGALVFWRGDTLVNLSIGASTHGTYTPVQGARPHEGKPVERLQAVVRDIVWNPDEELYLRALAQSLWRGEWGLPPLRRPPAVVQEADRAPQ